jgi:hypothetical protein
MFRKTEMGTECFSPKKRQAWRCTAQENSDWTLNGIHLLIRFFSPERNARAKTGEIRRICMK